MIIDDGNWTRVERPGYFGRHRDARYKEYDERFGAGNWQLAWSWGGLYLAFEEAVTLYEDAYWHFLSEHPAIVSELTTVAANVYDDALSNLASELDYRRQETGRTHLQDIAIRRSLVRLGTWFTGSELLRIRDTEGEHPLSLTLSPGRVPFHQPGLILTPELEGWWQPGSVESFYQSNKCLLVRKA